MHRQKCLSVHLFFCSFLGLIAPKAGFRKGRAARCIRRSRIQQAAKPPYACCPRSGQQARRAVSRALPSAPIGASGLRKCGSRRFARGSGTANIEKAAAPAEEGARRLVRRAPSRGGRFAKMRFSRTEKYS